MRLYGVGLSFVEEIKKISCWEKGMFGDGTFEFIKESRRNSDIIPISQQKSNLIKMIASISRKDENCFGN